MTVIDRAAATDVVERASALGPTIAARAMEIEALRRLPDDLLRALLDAGCFRALLPQSHGGGGADIPTALRLFETLARADASVGWTVMIGAASWCDLVVLPRSTFDELFSSADVIVAGALNPSGSIEADGDGYRVNGRWGFASGCEAATLIFANCIEGVVDGQPQLRAAVLNPGDVVIEDTWKTSGLRGTGSHHFRADDVRVPGDRTFVPFTGEPCIDETIVHVWTPAVVALCVASVAVGTAQGALDDIVALAAGKVPLFESTSLATNPLFQHELGSSDTALRAARALLHEVAESVWAAASDRTEFSLELRGRARAAAVWITEQAADVVGVAHRFGGGSSVYSDCPLQRRLRDIHAVTQHFIVKPDTLTAAGAVYAGQDPTLVVF